MAANHSGLMLTGVVWLTWWPPAKPGSVVSGGLAVVRDEQPGRPPTLPIIYVRN